MTSKMNLIQPDMLEKGDESVLKGRIEEEQERTNCSTDKCSTRASHGFTFKVFYCVSAR